MEVLESVTTFARKNKVNPRFLHGLVERYRIEPDAIHDRVKFYQPQRLREIVRIVDHAMKEQTK